MKISLNVPFDFFTNLCLVWGNTDRHFFLKSRTVPNTTPLSSFLHELRADLYRLFYCSRKKYKLILMYKNWFLHWNGYYDVPTKPTMMTSLVKMFISYLICFYNSKSQCQCYTFASPFINRCHISPTRFMCLLHNTLSDFSVARQVLILHSGCSKINSI